MKIIKIKNNDVNKRLDNFLSKIFINVPMSSIYKNIRNKFIKVNNKKTTFNYKLQLGDEIQVYCNFEQKQKDFLFLDSDSSNLEVIFEDNNILIINKKHNELVYDEKNEKVNTLLNKVKKYLYLKKQYDPSLENSFSPYPAHRLDTNTKGLIVFAKNSKSLEELNYIFKNKLIDKYYLTMVYGILKNSGTINCFIKKLNNNLVDCSYDKKDPLYKEAITKYKFVKNVKNKYTILDINLITGRTHQIRASLNLLGYPIVGEKKYIKKYINKDNRYKYQCLVSYKLKFKNLDEIEYLRYLSNLEFQIKNINFEVENEYIQNQL